MRQAFFCPYNKCGVHVCERRREGGGEIERTMRVHKEKEMEKAEEREKKRGGLCFFSVFMLAPRTFGLT